MEMLFDKRFGSLEEEIIKEEQTFIKAVGDFLANAFKVGFCLLGFTRSARPRNLKRFFDSFDMMYEYAELFIRRRIKDLEEKS